MLQLIAQIYKLSHTALTKSRVVKVKHASLHIVLQLIRINHPACVCQPEDQSTPEITRSQTAACKPTIPCLSI